MSESQDAAAPGATLFASADTGKDGKPIQLVPRFGRVMNSSVEAGVVPIAVLSIGRLHDQADWSVKVSLNGAESVVAVSRQQSAEDAAESAWRDLCLAGSQIGKGA